MDLKHDFELIIRLLFIGNWIPSEKHDSILNLQKRQKFGRIFLRRNKENMKRNQVLAYYLKT